MINYYLEGYQDAQSGSYDSRYAKHKEYNRGWDDAVRRVYL